MTDNSQLSFSDSPPDIRPPGEFQVLGETGEFLAVDKPAGLLVHPTKPGGPRTLWDDLKEFLGYELANGGQVSLINRLDRETSGIVLVAKSAVAARTAGLAMQRGEIFKEYTALVFGWPDWEERELDAPIVRRGEVEEAEVYLERKVHPSGSRAATQFLVENRLVDSQGRRFARVRARPLTGRTHQIRVHLAHLGYPVLGDKLYAAGSSYYLDFIAQGWTPRLEAALWLPRHALHCRRMGFAGHDWVSPLPTDLRSLGEREGEAPAEPFFEKLSVERE